MTKRTSHLNLRWTVADMDRLQFIRHHSHWTAEQIAEALSRHAYEHMRCGPHQVRVLAAAFGVRIKSSLIKAVGC